ncbi:MAG: hypothetical protein WDO72_01985 [Pseudomonadota bacterium]
MSLRSNQWFRRAAIGVTGVTFILFGIRAALHVANGDAADTFTNVKGMHISWGTALVFLVCLAAAFGAALIASWWHGRGGWFRFVRFRNPRIQRVDAGEIRSSADMPSNKSLERTRDR